MYKYNDDTLMHSVGFNFCAIESIMKNGIVSEEYGKNNNISINRNYFGSNLDDTISCVRYLYVNEDVEDSAYNKYVKKGISFIIEDVPFIYEKNERVIHRSDEVLVKDYIPKEKIVGINIPTDLMDADLEKLEYIKENSTSYVNIKHNADAISEYIKQKSGLNRDYNDFYIELYGLNEDFRTASKEEQANIKKEFKDTIKELNCEIGLDFYDCFSRVLGKEDITVFDIINHINKETLNVPIYEIETKKERKGSR